jgi:choline dehydrogenase
LEAGVTPYNGLTFEHLIGTKVGGSLFDSNGYRHTAADLLTYANPDNIDVYIWGTVQQILMATSPAGIQLYHHLNMKNLQ